LNDHKKGFDRGAERTCVRIDAMRVLFKDINPSA